MLRKGQAAMEFLMTYGWAILVVLIAIGALAYFGVLNPSKFLPESCTIGPGFSCEESKVNAVGTIQLLLRNGAGSGFTNVGVGITPDGQSTDCTPAAAANGETGDTLADGAILGWTSGITLTACPGNPFTVGNKFKCNLTVSYTLNGIRHTKTGSINRPVE